jgi:hypothetical protein
MLQIMNEHSAKAPACPGESHRNPTPAAPKYFEASYKALLNDFGSRI